MLLYKILIFAEEAFEVKGYFQLLANQCCISLAFSPVYLRQTTNNTFCWQNMTKINFVCAHMQVYERFPWGYQLFF